MLEILLPGLLIFGAPTAIFALLLAVPSGKVFKVSATVVFGGFTILYGLVLWDSPDIDHSNVFLFLYLGMFTGFALLACLWRGLHQYVFPSVSRHTYLLRGAGILTVPLFGIAALTGFV